jgi:hypothetical protein
MNNQKSASLDFSGFGGIITLMVFFIETDLQSFMEIF